MDLFGRYVEVQIDTRTFNLESLDIEFEAQGGVSASQSKANVADITIWNLNDETKAWIKKGQTAQITAGYTPEGNYSPVFLGTISAISSERSGGDIKTVITVTDAMATLRGSKKINLTLAKGSSVYAGACSIAAEAGAAVGKVEDPGMTFEAEYTASGNAAETLKALCDHINGRLKRDGTIKDLDTGGWKFYTYNDLVYLVSADYHDAIAHAVKADTGLISVEPQLDSSSGGVKGYKVTTLLNPKIGTNSLISVTSAVYTGAMKVSGFSHKVNSSDFTTEMECTLV